MADAALAESAGPTHMDAASLLRRACDAMQPGELLHDDSFSLFESISAVEIGELSSQAFFTKAQPCLRQAVGLTTCK